MKPTIFGAKVAVPHTDQKHVVYDLVGDKAIVFPVDKDNNIVTEENSVIPHGVTQEKNLRYLEEKVKLPLVKETSGNLKPEEKNYKISINN